ncbi:MAG: hypothetical protein IIB94_09790 [Candidatus Marinimicrobia bacterium]|nr:hypothetical protein [Candidatus Neomarinimicrobiota bacterium]
MKSKQEAKYYHPLSYEHFDEQLGEFWKIPNSNFERSVNNLPTLWKLFNNLDTIFHRGLDDCSTNAGVKKVTPLLFFWQSHRYIRASIKPLFSTQLPEALNILRMSIEPAVIGKKMLDNFNSIKIWIEQDKTEDTKKEYNKMFVKNKRNNLFPENDQLLNSLYSYWQDYSNLATHSNKDGTDFWLISSDSDLDKIFNVKYVEHKESIILASLISALSCSEIIEKLFYREFNSRLKLDTELARLRYEFSILLKNERLRIIKKFKLKDFYN